MIKLKLLSNKIKKPFRSRENILAIYSPKKYIIPEADAITIDTEINVVLPLKQNPIRYHQIQRKKNQRDSRSSKKEIENNAVESLLVSYAHCGKGEYCWLYAISKRATEKLRTENVGLEKILAENVGGKMEVSSAVTISPMLAETWSIKLVKLLLVLLAKLRQTLTKSPNRELIRSSEMGEPN